MAARPDDPGRGLAFVLDGAVVVGPQRPEDLAHRPDRPLAVAVRRDAVADGQIGKHDQPLRDAAQLDRVVGQALQQRRHVGVHHGEPLADLVPHPCRHASSLPHQPDQHSPHDRSGHPNRSRSPRGSGMRSVDLRTRRGADVRPVDAAAFFDDELPAASPGTARSPSPVPASSGVRPFAIEVDGAGVDAAPRRRRRPARRRRRADDAAAVVRLDDDGLHDLVNDLRTPMGFFTGGDLDMPTGRLEDFLDWWVVLRSLLDGRPVHTRRRRRLRRPGRRAARPAPLVPHRRRPRRDGATSSPRPASSTSPGVFTEDEMAAVSADMDAAAAGYAPGDGRSWWARTADGDDRLVRMQYFQEHSPTTAGAARRRPPARASAGSPPTATEPGKPGANAQPRRGAGEADRHRRGHLRRARGTRTAASAATPTGAARSPSASRSPAPTPSRVSCASSPARTGRSSSRRSSGAASTCPSSTCRPAPATSPCTSAARCT